MEKVWYLKKINILKDLTMDEMKIIEKNSIMKDYQKKEIIYSQDDKSDYIYFLKMGKLKLYKLSNDGKQLTLAVLTSGDSFGSISRQDKESYNEFAEVIENAMICFIDKKLFFNTIKNNPTVSLRLNKLLGIRVYELEMMLEELIFKTVLERTASLLFRLHKKYISPVLKNQVKNKIGLSHNDLATMIGATREATTIALNKLKNAGIIELTRNSIMIRNQNELKNFKDM